MHHDDSPELPVLPQDHSCILFCFWVSCVGIVKLLGRPSDRFAQCDDALLTSRTGASTSGSSSSSSPGCRGAQSLRLE
jgi:hypothetical protein